MSKFHGAKGKNYTAKPRKKPTQREVARQITAMKKRTLLRPYMNLVADAKTAAREEQE